MNEGHTDPGSSHPVMCVKREKEENRREGERWLAWTPRRVKFSLPQSQSLPVPLHSELARKESKRTGTNATVPSSTHVGDSLETSACA